MKLMKILSIAFGLLAMLNSCEKDEDNLSDEKKVLIDQFNNSTSIGSFSGISFSDTLNSTGAVFKRNLESRIEYSFPDAMPHEGTIEMRIMVMRGYTYDDYELDYSNSSAVIFNTGIQDHWYLGVMNFRVSNNGSIQLNTGIDSNPTSKTLTANGTSFKFNEWHIVGFSYGDQGQYLMVDGEIVASNTEYTYSMQSGGDWGKNRCIPTLGELKSVFWENNQYDRGFEGIVDYLRISTEQKDWGDFVKE